MLQTLNTLIHLQKTYLHENVLIILSTFKHISAQGPSLATHNAKNELLTCQTIDIIDKYTIDIIDKYLSIISMVRPSLPANAIIMLNLFDFYLEGNLRVGQ